MAVRFPLLHFFPVGEWNYGNRDQPLRQHVYRFRTETNVDVALTPTPPSSTVQRASRTLSRELRCWEDW